MLEGVASQLDIGAQSHLFGDTAAVGANGFLTQRELGGDLLDSPAASDHAQDLQFAAGEAVVRCLLEVAAESGSEFLGKRSGDVPSARQRFFRGCQKFIGGAALVQIAGGA